ncbi:unnamed protein product [Oppiella nova]|uniref:C2H2-type domain-containing protein n=1 Tax=Oppiella nova TaxID=334625 RepID=A0A7R9QGC1_9ACAR|nr:unnamed protein product [Oppiella nova]CAG2165359.1 unnamed protein product [Oppiella nova]
MECRRKSGRTVVITQGKDAVLVAKTDSPDVIEFPVKVVDESLIVDTIGAGDAFVGGFFAQLVRNRPLEVCVESGIYAAQEVIQQIGAHFPKDMTFDKTSYPRTGNMKNIDKQSEPKNNFSFYPLIPYKCHIGDNADDVNDVRIAVKGSNSSSSLRFSMSCMSCTLCTPCALSVHSMVYCMVYCMAYRLQLKCIEGMAEQLYEHNRGQHLENNVRSYATKVSVSSLRVNECFVKQLCRLANLCSKGSAMCWHRESGLCVRAVNMGEQRVFAIIVANMLRSTSLLAVLCCLSSQSSRSAHSLVMHNIRIEWKAYCNQTFKTMTEGSESDGGNAIESPSNTITTNISKGQLFGPFSNPLHWLSLKSCDNNRDNNPTNELFCRIEIARHSDEQNLKVIHKNGNFYFKATRDMSLDESGDNGDRNVRPKLYAWFSTDLETRLPTPSMSCINGSTRYFCPLCNQVFLYSNCVVTHILCICPKRIQIDSIPVPSNTSNHSSRSSSTPRTGDTTYTQHIPSLGNGSAQPDVKPQPKRKRGFDIASLVREESNESFPLNKRNKSSEDSDNKCDESLTNSSAFHRPKSPPIVRKSSPMATTSSSIDMISAPLMTSAFKKVDHKMSSVSNPYDFSALYQRVATSSMLPSSGGPGAHPLLHQMAIPAPITSSLSTSLSSTSSKSLVSNTLLPYLPPSLAALTFPTTNWCAKCNASFRMTSDLVYHMRSHHKNALTGDTMKKKREEKLRCNICNETFRERHHLTRHMTSHQ